MAGLMLSISRAALTIKACGSEVAPPLVTEMLAMPGDVTRLAGTTAVNWLAPTKVVPNGEPFQLICELESNGTRPTAGSRSAASGCTFSTPPWLPAGGVRNVGAIAEPL